MKMYRLRFGKNGHNDLFFQRLFITLTAALILFTPCRLQAEDPFEKTREAWKASQDALEKEWNELKCKIESEWDEHEKRQKEEWERLKAEVEQKWQKFIHSTKKDWVEYNKQTDARSVVDFEHGKIVLETIVPAGDPAATEKARRKIEEQAHKIFSREGLAKERLLKDQVVNSKGKTIDPSNVGRYIREEALPLLTADPSTFQSSDGIKRKKYSVTIDMVPNHIRVRAAKYLPLVQGNAERFRLKPQLILAIIHTESSFNPLAISSCNAVGLMQIIPRYAGRDAYQFVHMQDRLVTPEYLYNPENNIKLGCAYLHLLIYKHFGDVGDELKNRYVSICGYNWGPTSVRRKIVDIYPIEAMSDREVYKLLRQKTPQETREYIKRVTERMRIYDLDSPALTRLTP
ncbi:MAG: murein transglycosylase domain-containing protein [Pseudomonadota bacterium]